MAPERHDFTNRLTVSEANRIAAEAAARQVQCLFNSEYFHAWGNDSDRIKVKRATKTLGDQLWRRAGCEPNIWDPSGEV